MVRNRYLSVDENGFENLNQTAHAGSEIHVDKPATYGEWIQKKKRKKYNTINHFDGSRVGGSIQGFSVLKGSGYFPPNPDPTLLILQ